MPYARLLDLCEGDFGKVARLVHVFVASTVEDMAALQRAEQAEDVSVLQQLAHCMRSACEQLDEYAAVAALKAIESLAQSSTPEHKATVLALCHQIRQMLDPVLFRARAFVRMHAPDLS